LQKYTAVKGFFQSY